MEYNKYVAFKPGGAPALVTIATGPVIIKDGKVLLDKHGTDEFWKFPGGRLLDQSSPRENATLKVKEELGLEVRLISDPYINAFERLKDGVTEYVILVHYLAETTGDVVPGSGVKAWAWHNCSQLPADCAPNIQPAVDFFLSARRS